MKNALDKVFKVSLLSFMFGLTLLPLTGVAQTALQAQITNPTANSSFATGASINFNSQATGGVAPYAYSWNFGDGTTFSSQNAVKAYALAGAKTVTLTVTDSQSNRVTSTVAVTITGDSTSPALAISNIQSTPTTNGATITWTTNKPATSRVIYDTASHVSIVGATAPNYGYANSTAVADQSPKVTEHSVTLSGLSANTQYFFRVISES